MIDLYTWSTPNGRKISIALEEMQLPYRIYPIDIGKGEQFAPAFLKISPNNRIPAIVDHDNGQTVFESGAILIYLAHKTGRFLPDSGPDRWAVLEWLMWQVGGFGPMLGQAHHFLYYNPGKSSYAETRYAAEAQRLYGVLDKRLTGRKFLCDNYSIADMAVWPWASSFARQGVDIEPLDNFRRWYALIAARPAVRRGFNVPETSQEIPSL